MLQKHSFRIILFLVIGVAIFPIHSLLATNSLVGVENTAQNDKLVTLNLSSGSNISTLDPALATDSASITAIQNFFLGLTDLDPYTNEIVPELATHWEVSDDGMTWTFQLRNDVMWMDYDPESEIATEIRPVVAADFEYAIKRACDPRHENYYGEVIARVIAGCEVVNQTQLGTVTDDLILGDTIRVTALDDITLEIQLQYPAAYFLSMTTMWVMNAVPSETIERFGDDWTIPRNIVTNGPYFVAENTRDVRQVFVRNETYPTDLWHGGNIDRVVIDFNENWAVAFDVYQENRTDDSPVYGTAWEPLWFGNPDLTQQLHRLHRPVVYYFGFNLSKPPFDNVHVRRAFSAVINRQAFIEQVRQGRGFPMIHFTPPGIQFAAPIDEVGVGFDPDYAREQLALAGYPNCNGFPEIDILTYEGSGWWTGIWAEDAGIYLNCDTALFKIQELELDGLRIAIAVDTPATDRPHAWTLGWRSDFPDAHNWLYDVLSCESDNPFHRSCSEVDSLLDTAAVEINPQRRRTLYVEVEDRFFGENGEFPISPIYARAELRFIKQWYTGPFETDGIYGRQHWDAYTIDMAAKRAARGE